MDSKYFLNYPIYDRIRLLLEDKNIDYVYKVLEKYIGDKIDIKEYIKVKLNPIRKELNFSGDPEKVAGLLYIFNAAGLTKSNGILSIQIDDLRVDITAFFTKLR